MTRHYASINGSEASSSHLGRSDRREHQIFCQFFTFFLPKTISSQTKAFCYKLTRLSHHFFHVQTDTDINSLKKIMLHNAASSKINSLEKHFLNGLRIQQQCKLNLFAENQEFEQAGVLVLTPISCIRSVPFML